jgi:tetratricopeptide (TPR) repeat protein
MSRKFLKILRCCFLSFLTAVLITNYHWTASAAFTPPAITANPTREDPSRKKITLEEQARSQYQKSNFTQAARLFEQAANQTQNPTQKALNLANLALCQQQLGQWSAAKTTIDQALNLPVQTAAATAQLLDIQGLLLLNQGNATDAIAAWQQAEKLHGDDRDRARASQGYQVQALQQLGLYKRAIELSLKQLSLPSGDAKNFTEKLKAIQPSPEAFTTLASLG